MLEVNIKESNMECIFNNEYQTKVLPYKDIRELHEDLMRIDFRKEYKDSWKFKDSKLEDVRIPEIGRVFYYNLFTLSRIPLPSELIKSYLYSYCEKLPHNLYKFSQNFLNKYPEYYSGTFKYEEIAGRICRAYNSYIREFELCMQINSIDGFICEYNMKKDINSGIDLIVKEKNTGKTFGIRSFIVSERSEKYLQDKSTNRHSYNNFSVKFPAKLSGENKNVIYYNQIAVYERKAVEDFLEEVAA